MKQMAKRKITRLKRFNMKKLIIVVIFCAFFLVGCSLLETKENKPTEEEPNGENIENKNGEDNPNINEGEDDPNGENNPNNNEDDPNGEDNPNNNEDQNEQFSFLEDDFKYDITILNKDNYKKTFKKDDYLEFYNVIKEYTYEKYEQCTSCTDVLYTIKYNDNIILVYEYNFFKINTLYR